MDVQINVFKESKVRGGVKAIENVRKLERNTSELKASRRQNKDIRIQKGRQYVGIEMKEVIELEKAKEKLRKKQTCKQCDLFCYYFFAFFLATPFHCCVIIILITHNKRRRR
jgi:hypothetical protein